MAEQSEENSSESQIIKINKKFLGISSQLSGQDLALSLPDPGSIPGQELRSHKPHSAGKKNKNNKKNTKTQLHCERHCLKKKEKNKPQTWIN